MQTETDFKVEQEDLVPVVEIINELDVSFTYTLLQSGQCSVSISKIKDLDDWNNICGLKDAFES